MNDLFFPAKPATSGEFMAFHGAKTRRLVPYKPGLVHDLLVQLSLDPDIDAIDLVEISIEGSPSVDMRAITVEGQSGKCVLDIEPAQAARGIREHELVDAAINALGLTRRTMTGAQIMGEPRFSMARAIWKHRHIVVPTAMEIKLKAALDESGPMSLHELCSAVPGPIDPVGAIASLACAAVLDLRLEEGFDPASIVRRRQ